MVISITFAAAFLVFLCGLIAVILAIRDKAFNNATTWFYVAYWITALALLGGVVIR